MKKFYLPILFFLFSFFLSYSSFSQARLVINEGAYIVIDGNATNNAYLVVENTATNAITRTGVSPKWIVSSNQYSILKWQLGATSGAHEYPFGYSTDYVPVTVNNSGNAGWILVSTWVTGADNTPVPAIVDDMQPSGATTDASNLVVDRWWNITSTLASPLASSVALSLSYTGAENTVAGGTSELGIQHWDDAGSKWDDGKGGADGSYTATGTNGSTAAGAHTVSASGFTYFSPFVLTRIAAPLPMHLLSFSGNCEKGNVILHWETATEINNDFFTLERSTDEESFEVIGTKKGAGNSSVEINYEFIDQLPTTNYQLFYYRLKQTDFDGSFTYSETIAIQNCQVQNNSTATIYIGANNRIFIAVNSGSIKKYNVSFYDMVGKIIHSEILNVPEGNNIYILNPEILSTGIYFITLQNEEEIITQKLFIH